MYSSVQLLISIINIFLLYFQIKNFSIDYGRTNSDPNKGLWLLAEGSEIVKGLTKIVWYKLHKPAPNQSANISDDRLVRQVLNISDCLIYTYNDKVCEYDDKSNKYTCAYSFVTLYEICHKKFDLNFIKNEPAFVFNQLAAAIDMKQSKLFDRILPPGK
jgi:hypothetical protein